MTTNLYLPRLAFLFALVCPAVVPVAAWAACVEGQGLTLLHFNDFHGQLAPYPDPQTQAEVGGIARLAAAVAAVRAEDQARPVVLLFAGDLLQGTVTSSLFLGIPDVALFERMGVDAAAMGNHEFDYGQEVFRHLAGLASFPFLTANVETHPEPLLAKASIILAKPGGPRVAVLGLTTPELTTATHPRNVYGVSVEEPVAAARRLVPGLKADADLVVVLSHMGIADDRRLAAEVPQVDVIVGGHNHNVYPEPVMVGEVAILQAGDRGHWLGRMDLACRDGRLVRTGYRLLPMDATAPQDPEVAAEVARTAGEAEQGLAEAVGETAVELGAGREEIRRGEAVFGDWVADLAREITQADLALFNGGGFRAGIPAGTVTLKHVYQAFPFRNELVVGGLTGAQILTALQRSAAFDPLDNPGGFLQVSGARYTIAADGTLAEASIAGRPIDPQRVYRVVTSDFLAAGGDGYASLQPMQDQVMSGRLISDMVIEAFRTGGTVAPQLDGRIRRLSANPAPLSDEANLASRVVELEGIVGRLTRRVEVLEAAQASAAGPDAQLRSGKDLAWQFDGYTGDTPFKVSQQELDRRTGRAEVLLQLVAEPKDAAIWRATAPGAEVPLEVTATLSGGAVQGPIAFTLKRQTGLEVGRQVHIQAQFPEGDAKAIRRLVVRHRDQP